MGTPPADRTARGRAAEGIAARYLAASGFVLLARNVRYRGGELDLVAREGDEIVFVEVRSRRAGSRFDPAATLGPAKRAALLRAASRWLDENKCGQFRSRIDVVTVETGPRGYRIRLIRGAFADGSP